MCCSISGTCRMWPNNNCKKSGSTSDTASLLQVHTLIEEKIVEYSANHERKIYTTPRTFFAFINTFKSIYEAQSKVLEDRTQRIQTALKKLRDAGYALFSTMVFFILVCKLLPMFASEYSQGQIAWKNHCTALNDVMRRYQVSEMKNELLRREQDLEEAHETTAELLKSISMSTMHVERKKGEVQAAKKKISERAHEIQQERSTLELDLESAKPLLLEAQVSCVCVHD